MAFSCSRRCSGQQGFAHVARKNKTGMLSPLENLNQAPDAYTGNNNCQMEGFDTAVARSLFFLYY
jgi:hypothetical protein